MEYKVQVRHSFPVSREKLFPYFLDKNLVEQWSMPEGMTLKVPEFEASEGGRYKYVHTDQKGRKYECVGHVEKLKFPNRMVMIDEKISGPDGKVMYENLRCVLELKESGDRTEVTVTQTGFRDAKGASECQRGWEESFHHLGQLVGDEKELSKSA